VNNDLQETWQGLWPNLLYFPSIYLVWQK